MNSSHICFTVIACLMILVRCSATGDSSSDNSSFRIIQADTFETGYIQVMVHAKDTNWIQMESFAQQFVQDNEMVVVIAFSLTSRAGFKKNNSLSYAEDLTGLYKRLEGSTKFEFTKFPFGYPSYFNESNEESRG